MNIIELEKHIGKKISDNVTLKYNFGVVKPKINVIQYEISAKAIVELLLNNNLINKDILEKTIKLK